MDSRITQELKLKYAPVAALAVEEPPAGALSYEEGQWGCVTRLYADVATKHQVAAFSAKAHGCPMGGVGLCLRSEIMEPPGGLDFFLSSGAGPGFREGEGYLKTPAIARRFISELPVVKRPFKTIVLKPLELVDESRDVPLLVTVFATSDELSALCILANYPREGNDAIYAPFGAGCHTLFLFPFNETWQEAPRAVIGCMDISARPNIPAETLSFTVPYTMWQNMEADVPGSFLERGAFKKLRERM